jgi:cellulose synthase (UDP-forming)
MASRDRRVHLLALLALGYGAWYLVWRASQTLNVEALGLSLLLLSAEASGLLSLALLTFVAWSPRRGGMARASEARSVAVLVMAGGGSTSALEAALEATLVGCRGLRGPHTTYLAGPPERPELESMAARLGARYLTIRPHGAGWSATLNRALAELDEELVLILDSETVPQPDLLDQTLGYFADERVAAVQLPREFYNLDSAQHAKGGQEALAWHDEALFWRVLQPGRNRWNAALWCGSPSIVRRAALASALSDAVGGGAEENGAEGMRTSERLHAAGWKSVFHAEALAFSLAPATMRAYLANRLRRVEGAARLMLGRSCPITLPGLTVAQRLCYAETLLSYTDGYRRLVFLITPVLILADGQFPVQVGALDFLIHWAPLMALILLARSALGRGSYRWLESEQYSLIRVFTDLWGFSLALWPLRGRGTAATHTWEVSRARERWLMAPHHLLLWLLALSFPQAVGVFAWALSQGDGNSELVLLALFWAIAGATVLAMSTSLVFRRVPYLKRRSYRFSARLAASLLDQQGRAIEGTTEDLSLHGLAVRVPDGAELGGAVRVQLELPDGPLVAEARIVNRRRQDGWQRWGLELAELEGTARARWLGFLYVAIPRLLASPTSFPAGLPGSATPLRRAA